MNTERKSILDALYEAPGRKMKRRIGIATFFSIMLITLMIVLIVRKFAVSGQLAGKHWSFFLKLTTWKFLGEGLLGTLKSSLSAGAIAFSLGLIYMILRIGKFRILRWLGTVLTEFTRGVPTLLFIYFFFLVVPQIGWKLSAFWKIVLPVAISASGTVAEILRSGLNAVPKGQREAALSLGMRESHVFRKILFPQAFRYVIPSLISDLVIVVKDTTFAYVVNYPDLMQNAKVLISNYDSMLSVYLVIAVIYILINYLLNRLSLILTNRRKRSEKGGKENLW